jgi:SpoVK/Ycf46/Vps4 family AAA+-type ATPase
VAIFFTLADYLRSIRLWGLFEAGWVGGTLIAIPVIAFMIIRTLREPGRFQREIDAQIADDKKRWKELIQDREHSAQTARANEQPLEIPWKYINRTPSQELQAPDKQQISKEEHATKMKTWREKLGGSGSKLKK